MMSRTRIARLRRVLTAALLGMCIALVHAQSRVSAEEELVGEEAALYEKGLDLWLDRIRQLQSISQRIRVAGEDLCGEDVSPVFGIALARVSELPKSLRKVGKKRFGEDDHTRVVGLIEGFPAERAGLKVGDEVLTINGERVISTTNLYGVTIDDGSLKVVLGVSRDGQKLDLPMEGSLGCRYPAELVDSEVINAYADGIRVVFFSGLLRAFVRDEPIALVMGHEIGHNIQTNTTGQRTGGVVGEARADYIGAYMAERAGYHLTREDFGLAELEFASPRRITLKATTHPTGPARVLAFQRTLAEISAKLESGDVLSPNVAGGGLP
jgi:hypothetical protein